MQNHPRRVLSVAMLSVATTAVTVILFAEGPAFDWPQWGQNPQHQGFVRTVGQAATSILTDTIDDPFTAAEERDPRGVLLVHYHVPPIDGGDAFMEFKGCRFIQCSPPGSGNPPPVGTASCPSSSN